MHIFKTFMKNYLFIMLVLSGVSVNAQIRRFEFSGGIGNNGQIQKVLDDYFYISNPLYILDETQSAEATEFKYHLSGKLFINDHLALRLKYGKSKTQNSYFYDTFELEGNFSNNQTTTNWNPALCFNKNFGKLNISTGFEFAFYNIHKFESYFQGNEVLVIQNPTDQPNYYVPRNVESEITIEGGKAIAINCFLELEYLFSKRVGLGANVSYGYLWTKFGDEIIQMEAYKYPDNNLIGLPGSSYYTHSKSYKHKAFSPPEISVFLFLRLGKILEAPMVK